MKKKQLVVMAFVLLLFANSCKDKKQINIGPGPAQLEYASYSHLKIGNYWIYQIFDVDSLGAGSGLPEFDSCYVDKDTIINGNTYYRYSDDGCTYNFPSQKWYRDSLHYIVDSYGKILFSSVDFTTVFSSGYEMFNTTNSDTLCFITQKMEDKDVSITVPAGTFLTSDFRTTRIMNGSFSAAGAIRILHCRYSADAGIVFKTLPFFINDPRYKEMRLLRYHVAP